MTEIIKMQMQIDLLVNQNRYGFLLIFTFGEVTWIVNKNYLDNNA